MNIYDFAIKMELDGKALYENMAKETSIPGLKTIFTGLARDEQKHYEIFQALKSGAQSVQMADSTALATSQNVFEALMADRNVRATLKGNLESYRFAMKVEADSFRLYEEAAQRETRPETKQLLLRIAGEEHKHFNILENIHAFVNAPTQYLAWGEFSNLDEFRNFGRSVDV